MTLDIYLARRFLASFGAVFALFFALLTLIDMVDQLSRFSVHDITFAQGAKLAALNIPQAVYRILPLIVIISAIAAFVTLARSSELVVMRGAGRAGLRILLAPVVTAFVLGALAVAVFNPLAAVTNTQYHQYASALRSGTASTVSVRPEGLWLRQGGPLGQTVISAERAGPDGTELFNVTFLTFSPDEGPVLRIRAVEARLVPGFWQLHDAKEWRLQGVNPERDSRMHETLNLPTDLTAGQIRDSFASPESIPIWDLPGFIDALERAGLSTRAHRIWLHMELALPIMLASLVMLGAGFTMHHSRTGHTGFRVLVAILIGFGLFFLRNFAQVLGENGQLPLMVAAWSPPAATMLLSLGLLLHLEDG